MPQEHYLFVGNPGVGKSTLLNGMLGYARFDSGITYSNSLTYTVPKEEVEGIVYMDTPGLADVAMRKQAAAAISECLKEDGNYKIFFVFTLEAGRVRPADSATMKLVLDAAPEIKHNYGVIVNKVSKHAKRAFDENPQILCDVLAQAFREVTPTAHVHLNLNDPELYDEDLIVKPLPVELARFIDAMPPLLPPEDNVAKPLPVELARFIDAMPPLLPPLRVGLLQEHYLFVGNPGVGKSTLLNGMLGEARFRSGVSYGKGLTSVVQKEEVKGKVYMDTPGLADVAMRKEAAAAISECLKKDGNYKIFFVFTLEAGRVRPADSATMKLVLDAAPEIKHNYGVIVNKVSKRAMKDFEKDPQRQSAIFDEVTPTAHVHLNPYDEDLDDEDNVAKPLPVELARFIDSMPPLSVGN